MGDMIDRDAALAVAKAAGWDGELFVRGIAALPPVTVEPKPAPDAAAIREAWEKAYWRLRSYAVHDNDCKLNKPPRFDGPCSCGLTAALEEALALITDKPPTEYQQKVAQMKEDFPNGI